MNNPDFEINLNKSTLDNQKSTFELDNKPVEFTVNLNGGARGLKGDKGDTGATGPQGEQGPQGIQGPAGQDGRDGQDGFSPSASVSKSGATTTITITDKDGTTTAEVEDGIGDMEKSVYDTDNNGIVDNAEKVNNHSVDIDVPSNAVFTDTTYTAGTGISISAENVISNTQTSAEWGNISGDIQDQSDLQSALGDKADASSLSSVATSGDYDDLLNKPTIPSATSDLNNDSGFIDNTVNDLTNYTLSSSLSTVATSGNYSDLNNKPTIPDELADLSDDSTHRVVTDTEKTTWSGKQDALVSGTNIKTINSTTILGSGNFALEEEIPQQDSAPATPSEGDLWIDTDENVTPCYDNYSTNETQIGYWIDGKPLYRKTIETTTPSNTNVDVIGTLSNVDTITNIYGMLKYGVQQVPLTLAYNTSVLNAILIEGNNINCKVSANAYTNCSCFVVVEYTKTTD